MGRSFGSAGAGAVSLMFAIIIAKAGAHPNIWYGWILTDPRVVPALLLFSLVCFAISLGQLHSVRVFYWAAFSRLFPAPEPRDKDKPANEPTNGRPPNERVKNAAVPRITGNFSRVTVIRSGVVIENREDAQRWRMCGLNISVSASTTSTLHIKDVRIAT